VALSRRFGLRATVHRPKHRRAQCPNFTDPSYMISLSDTDLWQTVTNGLGPGHARIQGSTQRRGSLVRSRLCPFADLGKRRCDSLGGRDPNLLLRPLPPRFPIRLTSRSAARSLTRRQANRFLAGQGVTLRVIDLFRRFGQRTCRSLIVKRLMVARSTLGDVPRQLNMVLRGYDDLRRFPANQHGLSDWRRALAQRSISPSMSTT